MYYWKKRLERLDNMKRIEFCTENKSKFNEARNFINSINSNRRQICLEFNPIKFSEVQSLSQEEILIYKMKQVVTKTKNPFIIDETGIYFSDFVDFPGTLTKYIIKSIKINGVQKLLQGSNNSAYFKTTILYSPDGIEYKFFEGKITGKIFIDEAKMKNTNNDDFPFSTIFIPEGYNDCLKNIDDNVFLDHRKKALYQLMKYISV